MKLDDYGQNICFVDACKFSRLLIAKYILLFKQRADISHMSSYRTMDLSDSDNRLDDPISSNR